MRKYICKRLIQMLLVLVVVSVVSFCLIKAAPGDILMSYITPDTTPEELEQLKTDLGMDQSIARQYLAWAGNVLHGNWGYSVINHQSVLDQILDKLPATAGLMGASLVLSLLIAIPLGLLSGVRKNGVFDNIVSFISYIGISIPNFWLGILLILLFSLKLEWLPASGMHSIGVETFADLVKHTILPMIVISSSNIAVFTRYVRSNTISQMEEDYVLTAISKGSSPTGILFRHVMKNCLLPIITLVGMNLVSLVTGSFIIESVFGWPGLGTLSLAAVSSRDYPLIMGVTMLSCVVLIVGIFLSDIVYTLVDPRIKSAGKECYE